MSIFETLPAETQKERRQLYRDYIEELTVNEISNTEQYDKAILTLSTGVLTLSIGFLKDFIPIELATVPFALYASWTALSAAVIVTVVTFQISNYAISIQKKRAWDYYLECKEEEHRQSDLSNIISNCNMLAGGLFVIGMILSVVFVMANLKGASEMSNTKFNSSPAQESAMSIPSMMPVGDAMSVPSMVSVPAQPSAPAPSPATRNPVPATTQSVASTSSGSTK